MTMKKQVTAIIYEDVSAGMFWGYFKEYPDIVAHDDSIDKVVNNLKETVITSELIKERDNFIKYQKRAKVTEQFLPSSNIQELSVDLEYA